MLYDTDDRFFQRWDEKLKLKIIMTPKEKADELLKEFSKEKALDVVETMLDLAIEFDDNELIDYWQKVKNIINNKKPFGV